MMNGPMQSGNPYGPPGMGPPNMNSVSVFMIMFICMEKLKIF